MVKIRDFIAPLARCRRVHWKQWNGDKRLFRREPLLFSARVNDMHEVWQHPQLRARNRWSEVATPAGLVAALLPPGLASGEARMDPVPALGEHTDAILAEIGVPPDEIARLRAAKAI